MFSVFGALAAMALQSIKWFAIGGALAGVVLGAVGAFALVGSFNRALITTKQPSYVRTFGTVCCVVWAFLLPTSLSAAGLIWGLGHGLGNVVEGPISTTIRSTADGFIKKASEVGPTWLGRWALTKRLSEKEFNLVTQTAPRWLADLLLPNDAPAPWLTLTGVTIPPSVVAVVREGLREAPAAHPSWFSPVVATLRSRSQGPAVNHPTMQETLEAMIAPSVFEHAARAVRAFALSFVKTLLAVGLGASALFSAILFGIWQRNLVQTQEAT